MNKQTTFLFLCIPVLLCMILIFTLSAHTASESSDMSGGLIEKMAKILSPDFASMTPAEQQSLIDTWQFVTRKCAHFSIYALLGFLCAVPASLYLRGKSMIAVSLSITWLYAVSDEIHQYFVPGRSCEVRDILIDWCGAALGVAFFTLICTFVQRKAQKRQK